MAQKSRFIKFEKKLPNPSEGLREYLIIISPPAIIKSDVRKFKNEFVDHFGTAEYISSVAHISLSHFLIESTPEVTILHELRHLLKDKEVFEVQISGFKTFQNSKTLFLSISSSEILKLQHHMVAVLRKRAKISNSGTQKLKKPHITIASKIPDYQFNQSRNYFGRKSYTKKFVVEKITALRKNHSLNDFRYKVAFEIGLKPKTD